MSKHEKMMEYNKQHLDKVLERTNDLNEKHSHFFMRFDHTPKNFNLNILIYFLNDLLNMRVASKRLDDFTMLYILIFFYGFDLVELFELKLEHLSKFVSKNYSGTVIGLCNYTRLENFIKSYIEKYRHNFNDLNEILEEVIELESLNSGKAFNERLERLMKFMGYTCQIKYEDHRNIFCLLTIHLSRNTQRSMDYISKTFGYTLEDLNLMTLNQVYCKVQLPGRLEQKIVY